MKKLFLITTIIAVIASKSFAQQTRDAFSFWKIWISSRSIFSLPLGIFFGIQPEIPYSEKGFKASGSFLGSNYNATRTTSYLDVQQRLDIRRFGTRQQ